MNELNSTKYLRQIYTIVSTALNSKHYGQLTFATATSVVAVPLRNNEEVVPSASFFTESICSPIAF